MSKVNSYPVEEEYKKTTGITPDDISRLRQWLQTQPHLPQEHITDLDLILLYHRYGCSIEVSKQELDNQYTLRTLFASFFKDRVVDAKVETVLDTVIEMSTVVEVSCGALIRGLVSESWTVGIGARQPHTCPIPFRHVVLTILPARSKEGHTIYYARMVDPDLNTFDFATSIKTIFMVLDLWQYEEGTWPGFMFLFDLHGVKLGLITKLDIENIRQFVVYCPNALLVKLKSVHFINAPSFMDRFNTLMKNFMIKEFNDLVTVHQAGDLSGLANVLDINVLPKELGGQYKTLDQIKEETLSKMRANKDFFVEENKKRVNESLRPGKPKTITDIFGSVEGSFKQLEID